MVTKYPAAIDTVFTLRPLVDGQPVTGRSVEQLREAIIAIEEELGVKPSAVYTTVRNRLDVIENIVGNLRIIELEGDLGGTLETPLVIGIQGRPVSDVEPSEGQTLIWDGIAWIPGAIPADVNFAGDLTGNPLFQTVVGLQSRPLAATAPTSGQALVWDGAIWKPTLVAAGSSSIRAVASTQPIASQGVEPGWYVIGAFYLSTAITNATLETIGGVSDPSLTLTVRLFNLTTVSEVTGSRASITSIPDIRALSSVIASLPGNTVYQVQAEAISDFPGDAVFAVVKSVEITM
jgi:hypothetical protein